MNYIYIYIMASLASSTIYGSQRVALIQAIIQTIGDRASIKDKANMQKLMAIAVHSNRNLFNANHTTFMNNVLEWWEKSYETVKDVGQFLTKDAAIILLQTAIRLVNSPPPPSFAPAAQPEVPQQHIDTRQLLRLGCDTMHQNSATITASNTQDLSSRERFNDTTLRTSGTPALSGWIIGANSTSILNDGQRRIGTMASRVVHHHHEIVTPEADLFAATPLDHMVVLGRIPSRTQEAFNTGQVTDVAQFDGTLDDGVFSYVTSQSFIKWLGMGIDITHDVDEQRPSDTCRSIMFQRWMKELQRVTGVPNRLQYLKWLSAFMEEIKEFQGLWGMVNGTVLTFEAYCLGGGPLHFNMLPNYEKGGGVSLDTLKDAMTNHLTTVMSRNSRPFISLGDTGRISLLKRDKLEKIEDPIEKQDLNLSLLSNNPKSIALHQQLLMKGARVPCPQNQGFLGDNVNVTWLLDAFGRPATSGLSSTFDYNNMGANGDSATEKPMGKQPNIFTHNYALMHPQLGQKRTLQGNFSSEGVVTREHKMVLVKIPETQVKEIETNLELVMDQATRVVIGGKTLPDLLSDIASPSKDTLERRTILCDNFDKMYQTDERMKTLRKSRRDTSRAKTQIQLKKMEQDETLMLDSVRAARGLTSNVTRGKIWREEEEDKHAEENKLRDSLRPIVEDTLNNSQKIFRIEKSYKDLKLPEGIDKITPCPFYYLVHVQMDKNGRYYVKMLDGNKYYPVGWLDNWVRVLSVKVQGKSTIYLPLATILSMEESIRERIAAAAVAELATSPWGAELIQKVANLVETNPARALKIFAPHKEALLSILSHQSRHAHSAWVGGKQPRIKPFVHLGSNTQTHHLSTLSKELFGAGGRFDNDNVGKTGEAAKLVEIAKEGGEDEQKEKKKGPKFLMTRMLMAIMVLKETKEEDMVERIAYQTAASEQPTFFGKFIDAVFSTLLHATPTRVDELVELREKIVEFFRTPVFLNWLAGMCIFHSKPENKITNQNFPNILGDLLQTLSQNDIIIPPTLGNEVIKKLSSKPEEGMVVSRLLMLMCESVPTYHAELAKLEQKSYPTNSDVRLASRKQTDHSSRFDAKYPGDGEDLRFPVLENFLVDVYKADSTQKLELSSVTRCVGANDDVREGHAIFEGTASVRRVRIREYEHFQKFCDAVDTGSSNAKRKKFIETYWNQRVETITGATKFTETRRVVADRKKKASPSDVPGDNDDDASSVATKETKGFNSKEIPVFSRALGGISFNGLNSDQGPRALEMVYKDIAASELLLFLGLDLDGAAETVLRKGGFGEKEINAGIKYCLESSACEGVKTGGDFLQIVEGKIMNILFGQNYTEHRIPLLEIFGFTSFDRIAVIIAAIMDVPAMFLSSKAGNIAYGGLNTTTWESDGEIDERRVQLTRDGSLTPSMSLLEKVIDINWLGTIADRSRKRMRAFILALMNILRNPGDAQIEKYANTSLEELIDLLKHMMNNGNGKRNAETWAAAMDLIETITKGQVMLLKETCRRDPNLEKRLEIVASERIKILKLLTAVIQNNTDVKTFSDTLEQLNTAYTTQLTSPQQGASLQQQQQLAQQAAAEAKRIADEQAEAKRIADEQAEAKRIADDQAAALQQQQQQAAAEAKRIADEQAEAKRIADEQAAQKEAAIQEHQRQTILALIEEGKILIGALRETIHILMSPNRVAELREQGTGGEKQQGAVHGKHRKTSVRGEDTALGELRRESQRLTFAIEQAKRFLDKMTKPIITENPYYGLIGNQLVPISNQNIKNTIRELIARLETAKNNLGVGGDGSGGGFGGGSRKRRYRRRRKTRRKKKRRKRKTIRKRRKRGRKTRRK